MKNETLILNRSFIVWLGLLLSIFTIMVSINTKEYTLLNLFSTFVAGISFGIWLMDGFIQSYKNLSNYSWGLFKRSIDLLDTKLKTKTPDEK